MIGILERLMQRQGARKLLIVFLSILLVVVSGVAVYYWLFRRLPGPELPGIVEQTGLTVPHFVFSIDGIIKPASVATSPDGDRIFVTESGGERMIHIFDYKGEHINAFAPPDTTPLSREPAGIAVRVDGLVFVADSILQEIGIYSYDGEFIGFFMPDNDPDFDWLPVGVTLDKEGNIYVTDQQYPRHQVLVFDPAGNLKTKFGYFGIGAGLFNFPTDVAVEDNGNIFVSDSNNRRLQVFDAQGNFQSVITGDFSLPRGIGFDQSGRLHVVDTLGHEVKVLSFNSLPKLEATYGTRGLDRGQFRFPSDIALDGAGMVYITDYYGNRVQVWAF